MGWGIPPRGARAARGPGTWGGPPGFVPGALRKRPVSAVRDLSDASGLALWLVPSTGELALGDAVVSDPPYARTLDDLRPVLAEQGVQGAKLAYRVYRDVRSRGDETVLRESGLRYDVTVTPPGAVGKELVKTAGHYHTRSPSGPTYPEVYEVLNGRAAFVLQWVDDPEGSEPEVQEVWVAVCEAGEKIVIPSDCGHASINLGEEPLAVADLVSRDSENYYGSFREARGAAYYLMEDGSTLLGWRLEANPRYAKLPRPTILRRPRWEPFLNDGGPVYAHFIKDPRAFTFLSKPAGRERRMFDLWGLVGGSGTTDGKDKQSSPL